MALTYTCPDCGKIMLDSERYTHRCAGTNQQEKKCPDCGGTGRSTSATWIGSGKCQRCNGTGVIIVRY